MNRITIIGNGFDLACGLRSKYEHFLIHWINDHIKQLEAGKGDTYNNDKDLFYLEANENDSPSGQFDQLSSLKEITQGGSIRLQPDYSFLHERLHSTVHFKTGDRFKIVIRSKLFHVLLREWNWTDIEKQYFELVKDIYEKNQNSPDIVTLNNHFDIIKNQFYDYLQNLDKPESIDPNLSSKLDDIIDGNMIYEFYGITAKSMFLERFDNQELENTLLLNFNYTNLVLKYALSSLKAKELNIIQIHGMLDKRKSLIFGFGDEMNDFNRLLEETDNDEFVKNFKSNYYPAMPHYQNLIGFVESNEFDVVVIGHSLGLSDRVLLNYILEHENCKLIHLTYRGDKGHFNKRIALSRHFDNKQKLRKRLAFEIDFFKLDT